MSFLTRRLARRLGPIGVALTLYDIWKQLPEKEQQYLIAQGQKHGSRAVKVIKQEAAKLESRFG